MCNGGIDLPDVCPWLEKTLEERPYVRTVSLQRLVLVCLCVCVGWGEGGWSNIDWEVSERKYHMVAQIIKKCILGPKKGFINNVNWSSLIISKIVSALVCHRVLGWYLDLLSMFWCSIMLSVVSRLNGCVWYWGGTTCNHSGYVNMGMSLLLYAGVCG